MLRITEYSLLEEEDREGDEVRARYYKELLDTGLKTFSLACFMVGVSQLIADYAVEMNNHRVDSFFYGLSVTTGLVCAMNLVLLVVVLISCFWRYKATRGQDEASFRPQSHQGEQQPVVMDGLPSSLPPRQPADGRDKVMLHVLSIPGLVVVLAAAALQFVPQLCSSTNLLRAEHSSRLLGCMGMLLLTTEEPGNRGITTMLARMLALAVAAAGLLLQLGRAYGRIFVVFLNQTTGICLSCQQPDVPRLLTRYIWVFDCGYCSFYIIIATVLVISLYSYQQPRPDSIESSPQQQELEQSCRQEEEDQPIVHHRQCPSLPLLWLLLTVLVLPASLIMPLLLLIKGGHQYEPMVSGCAALVSGLGVLACVLYTVGLQTWLTRTAATAQTLTATTGLDRVCMWTGLTGHLLFSGARLLWPNQSSVVAIAGAAIGLVQVLHQTGLTELAINRRPPPGPPHHRHRCMWLSLFLAAINWYAFIDCARVTHTILASTLPSPYDQLIQHFLVTLGIIFVLVQRLHAVIFFIYLHVLIRQDPPSSFPQI